MVTLAEPPKTSAVKMRAHAMRMASVLANLPKFKKKKAGKTEYYDVTYPEAPDIRDWPEIDMDPLLIDSDDPYFIMDDGSAPAVWPVEIAFASPFGEDNNIRLIMCRTAAARHLRGYARRWSKYNVEVQQITLDKHGRIINDGNGYFGRFRQSLTENNDDFVWSDLFAGGHYAHHVGRISDRTTLGPALAIGHALRRRYEWSVIFEFPAAQLRFSCSARGILEMLKDRDKPPELQRRASLLHWVARYWRRSSTSEDLHEVRKHLRGVTRCQWRDLSVCLVPAEYEIEQALMTNA